MINVLEINGSDPGAVPGGSTMMIGGRNRIDERVKGLTFARWGTAVIGPNCTIANDNRAPIALAA